MANIPEPPAASPPGDPALSMVAGKRYYSRSQPRGKLSGNESPALIYCILRESALFANDSLGIPCTAPETSKNQDGAAMGDSIIE